MTKKEIADLAVTELEKLYPDVECSLVYDKPYELMIATRLAAQCTDARVNVVVEKLYEKFPDVEALAAAGPEEILFTFLAIFSM